MHTQYKRFGLPPSRSQRFTSCFPGLAGRSFYLKDCLLELAAGYFEVLPTDAWRLAVSALAQRTRERATDACSRCEDPCPRCQGSSGTFHGGPVQSHRSPASTAGTGFTCSGSSCSDGIRARGDSSVSDGIGNGGCSSVRLARTSSADLFSPRRHLCEPEATAISSRSCLGAVCSTCSCSSICYNHVRAVHTGGFASTVAPACCHGNLRGALALVRCGSGRCFSCSNNSNTGCCDCRSISRGCGNSRTTGSGSNSALLGGSRDQGRGCSSSSRGNGTWTLRSAPTSSAVAAAAAALGGGSSGGAWLGVRGSRRHFGAVGGGGRGGSREAAAAAEPGRWRSGGDGGARARQARPAGTAGSGAVGAGAAAESFAAAASLTDLTRPSSWYPAARSIRRQVVAHLGPTNSGKTHAALQALKAAPSGIYCGPLRLLACEVADRLASEGVPCNLVTGQEVRSAGRSGAPARHTACTVEMADVTAATNPFIAPAAPEAAARGATRGSAGGDGSTPQLDIAVLDEIQMLGDRLRGWAWTRALLGLAAREVHVAGDPAVLPLLRALVAECGDELRVHRYRRLSPLVVQSEALGRVAAVAGGDCLVAFSRRSLHGLRREVVRRSGREACLVYGALPPEARRQQAALFNASPPSPTRRAAAAAAACLDGGGGNSDAGGGTGEDAAATAPTGRRPRQPLPRRTGVAPIGSSGPAGAKPEAAAAGDDATEPETESGPAFEPGSYGSDTGFRVLCASDAIGMGLNLNIRRVVFTSLHKYDGAAVRPLQPSEVRQIAGRAGRFSSPHPTGYVTTLRPQDLPDLHRALAQPPEPITHACVLPSSEALAAYAAAAPDRSLAASLLAFAATARLGASYMYGNYDGMYRIASALRELDGSGSGALSAEEMLMFCTAPADMDDPAVAAALLTFVQLFCREGRVGPEAIPPLVTGVGCLQEEPPAKTSHDQEHQEGHQRQQEQQEPPTSEAELKRLEELHRVYDLYVWLCYRLPYAFTGREAAEAARAACGALIEAGLDRLAAAASTSAFGRRNHSHHHQRYSDTCNINGADPAAAEDD